MEKSRERTSNHRGLFILVGAVIVIGAIISTIALNANKTPNCAENEELKDGKCVAKREVDTYTFERDFTSNFKLRVKMTVEVPKSLGYVARENDVKIELYRETDRSTISLYSMLTNKNSIVMKESDYSKTVWRDYKMTEYEDETAVVEINKIRSDGSIYGVEWSKAAIRLPENTWLGVRVTAMASGLDQGKDSSFGGQEYKTFKARETFESEDFQYMLNSIKLTYDSLNQPD